MSSKSKKRSPDVSVQKAVSNAIVIFLWAFCTAFSTDFDDLEKLWNEIKSVRDSINCGALTIPQLRKAIHDEYGLEVY